MDKLTHVNPEGKANMVDVGHKPIQMRVAKATGFIKLQEATIGLIKENKMKKGDVLGIAEIAGIQAAKKTADLIPLCHNIFISKASVTTSVENEGIRVTSEISCTGQTGVEMEALTAVNIALLTIYDMCKAVDKTMEIENIKLISKTKSDI